MVGIFNGTLADLERKDSDAYLKLTSEEKVFTVLHKKLQDFAKTLDFKQSPARYKILYKAGFLLLFDSELDKTIASFEVLSTSAYGGYPLKERERTMSEDEERERRKKENKRKKDIRPRWTEDPQFPKVKLRNTAEGYERAHIATYSNHQAKRETRIESCYNTNGFSQISKFHAYRQVEEWAKQRFWKCDEVVVVTFLEYQQSEKPVRVSKILIWKCESEHIESVLTIFRFPNQKKEHKNEKHNRGSKTKKHGADYSFDYLETPDVLDALPFALKLRNPDRAYICDGEIKGKNWKSALVRVIKTYRSEKGKTTLMIVPLPHQQKKTSTTSGISQYLINIGIWLILITAFIVALLNPNII